MGKVAIAALVLAVLLGGCDPGPDAAADGKPAPVVTVRNDYHERMMQLDELPRGAALRKAIRSAGESCDRVESAAFQQDHGNLKMWTATCQRTAYAVFVAPNGDVQVRRCTDVAVLKLQLCRAPAGPPRKS